MFVEQYGGNPGAPGKVTLLLFLEREGNSWDFYAFSPKKELEFFYA